MTIYLILFFAGLLGGFLAGLLGIGGGLIYIFALTTLFEFLDIDPLLFPELVVANSIFAVFFASGAASVTLIRSKEFYLKEVLVVTIGSVLASILALKFLVLTSWYSVEVFNVVIIVILVYMLYRVLSQIRSEPKVSITGEEKSIKFSFLFAGASGGLIAALSGLGGGVVIVPILHTYLKLDMKKTRSISLGVILITSFFMTIYNSLQEIELGLIEHIGLLIPSYTIFIVLGVLIASPFGVKVGSRWSSKKIAIVYSVFLVLFLAKKISGLF